jgi:GMP synthase-like glutamine amidotransferase
MRVLAIVHERDAGPGVFADAAREHGVALESWHIAEGERLADAPERYDAVLALGGSMHPHEDDRHPWMAEEVRLLAGLLAAGRPVLGVCLGSQLLARATGGATIEMAEPEIGWYEVTLAPEGERDAVLGPLGPRFEALEWHSCAATPAGAAAARLAATPRCAQAFRVGETAWGIQFHAEVTLGDFETWITGYLEGDGVGYGPPDPAAYLAQTRERIAAWNALGRGLFGRFLDAADGGRAARSA